MIFVGAQPIWLGQVDRLLLTHMRGCKVDEICTFIRDHSMRLVPCSSDVCVSFLQGSPIGQMGGMT